MTHSISASILAANLASLGEEVRHVIKAGAQRIHFDVMDNHYVPNLSFGPMICEALRKDGITAPIDVHLMIKPVDNLIPAFVKAGANQISFHPEATDHVHRTIHLIKNLGCEAGLALNPATPLSHLDHVLADLDKVLIMSVNPGFGGQSFIHHALDKIRLTRQRIDALGLTIDLEVDGGINIHNIAQVAMAGATTFVAGSAIFQSQDYHTTITAMKAALNKL